MRKVVVSEFVTLDGVTEAGNGPRAVRVIYGPLAR